MQWVAAAPHVEDDDDDDGMNCLHRRETVYLCSICVCEESDDRDKTSNIWMQISLCRLLSFSCALASALVRLLK